ncbi:hypothetical protein Sgleb_72240 [Streptomyces glebosus]|uniref:Uncharacterized protein n=1 Tax=Streptomyces glebosus TaxID=249580 RepID=A0A640T632_9ACTN|nr:hypothetical protein Sgleb_72240 [Streptomyces glebosus]GHG77191.1 hypothetical protein GCM10010513_52670 [Streptomyces glebosus]
MTSLRMAISVQEGSRGIARSDSRAAVLRAPLERHRLGLPLIVSPHPPRHRAPRATTAPAQLSTAARAAPAVPRLAAARAKKDKCES